MVSTCYRLPVRRQLGVVYITELDEPSIEVKFSFYEGDPTIGVLKNEIADYSDSPRWEREEVMRFGIEQESAWMASVLMLLTADRLTKIFKSIGQVWGNQIKITVGDLSIIVRSPDELPGAKRTAMQII